MKTDFDLDKLIRDNIRDLTPYSSARDEFKGQASIYLDANENAFGSPLPLDAVPFWGSGMSTAYHRYPDPHQSQLKERISQIKGVPSQHIFLGNGSDEAIDLLFRAFCEPGVDNVILVPPTYGMYEVSANINNVAVRKVPLSPDFQLDLEGIAEAIDPHTKLIFLCSPNNPTGNSLNREDMETVLAHFNGIVVVDEAYINFARQKTFIQELTEYANLVVLQTFSKAWGLAGLRLGMAFASTGIIEVLNKIKPPYNINLATQDLATKALAQIPTVNDWIRQTVEERQRLVERLGLLDFVTYIFPSDANFVLVRTKAPVEIYRFLVSQGIIVRDRSAVALCEGCLRITVGTPDENDRLIEALNQIEL
ncbi:MAG TPA: histidinol-phosphate transaminase [Sphingobacteriaceae bacterium]|nr:histidinol-phosphate transaminase [Sphingobacteriaceae bacterium]